MADIVDPTQCQTLTCSEGQLCTNPNYKLYGRQTRVNPDTNLSESVSFSDTDVVTIPSGRTTDEGCSSPYPEIRWSGSAGCYSQTGWITLTNEEKYDLDDVDNPGSKCFA